MQRVDREMPAKARPLWPGAAWQLALLASGLLYWLAVRLGVAPLLPAVIGFAVAVVLTPAVGFWRFLGPFARFVVVLATIVALAGLITWVIVAAPGSAAG